MSWLKESNRPKHILAGLAVFCAAFVCAFPFLFPHYSTACIMAFIATVAAGASAEIKDELWGGSFDVLDLAATVLIPAVVTVVAVVTEAVL